jgi:hypothetical protein
MMLGVRLAIAAALLAPAIAHAEDPIDGGGPTSGDHAPVVNRINLRVGAATTDRNGHPTICLDVRVIKGFGVETCGTGAQVLHNDPGYEMMHVRATYSFAEGNLWKGTGHVRGGLGFAEMQVGIDHPGFNFGSPDKDKGSVAGPEASLSGQYLLPLYKGVDFVMTGTAGLALFAHADQLVETKSNLQSFVSVEAGIGW